jgi:hypothetical protein
MADKEKPSEQTKPTAASDAGAGPDALEGMSGETLLSGLRSSHVLSGIADGRDVSLVYIDRRKVQNYYGVETEDFQPHRPAAATAPTRRIGDMVVSPAPVWEVEMVQVVYQVTPALDPARRCLREYGLVVLHGRAGTGKRAAAIHLLGGLNLANGDGLIYELNPSLRLADLRAEDLPPHTALLLETPSGDALEGLTAWQLKALLNVLADPQRQCALVIVCEQPPRQLGRDHAHLACAWQVRWPQGLVAGQSAVLASHLRYLADQRSETLEDLELRLDRLLAEQDLRNRLQETLEFAQLAELARLLWPVVQERQSLPDALALFHKSAQGEVQAWFNEEHSPDLESLLIAAAVFNGAPYPAVSEAAQALASRLQPDGVLAQPAKTEEKPARPPSLFAGRDPRRQRLSAIHAHLAPTALRSHYGDVQEDAVVLENQAWQEAVLRYVWEFDDLRPPLLGWLQDYGVYGNHHLRTRAAAAIGALACDSFSLIEGQVLRRWADSGDPNVRRSAAQILGMTIWDETHSAASARLLHYWASQAEKPRWQWTAAAAYGGLAGPRYPQQTLADLKLIAGNTQQQPALLDPLFRALVSFYAASHGLPERRLALLQELVTWSQHQPKDKNDRAGGRAIQRTAVLGFWVMLWPERDDPVWSLLLADAGVAGAAQDASVWLMRQSLNFRQPQGSFGDGLHPRRLALDGLHSLVLSVARPHEPDQVAQLTALLQALVAACRQEDADELGRLRYAAEQWDDVRQEASPFLDIIFSS